MCARDASWRWQCPARRYRRRISRLGYLIRCRCWAASDAIGADRVRCVTMTGTGYSGMVGQAAHERLRRGLAARRSRCANYTRTMNWDARTMREEFDRQAGTESGVVEIRARLARRHAAAAELAPDLRRQWQSRVASWTAPATDPIAVPPRDAERWQLDLWLTPHGFLKAAAMPGANPKAVWRWELGEMGRDGATTTPEKVTVVSITVMGSVASTRRSTRSTCSSGFTRGCPIRCSAT